MRSAAAVHGICDCHTYEGERCAHSGNEGREEEAQICQHRQGSDAGEIRWLAVAQYPPDKEATAGKEECRAAKKE